MNYPRICYSKRDLLSIRCNVAISQYLPERLLRTAEHGLPASCIRPFNHAAIKTRNRKSSALCKTRLLGTNLPSLPKPLRAEDPKRPQAKEDSTPPAAAMAIPVKLRLLNVRSLKSKGALVHDQIISDNLDVFFLTETWMAPYSSDCVSETTPLTSRSFSLRGLINWVVASAS